MPTIFSFALSGIHGSEEPEKKGDSPGREISSHRKFIVIPVYISYNIFSFLNLLQLKDKNKRIKVFILDFHAVW